MSRRTITRWWVLMFAGLLLPGAVAWPQSPKSVTAAKRKAERRAVKRVLERIKEAGALALPEAVEAIATRQGGVSGRFFIIEQLAKKNLGTYLGPELEDRIRKELLAPRLADWDAVEALLLACREYYAAGGRHGLLTSMSAGFVKVCAEHSRPQTALLAIRAWCETPDDGQRMTGGKAAIRATEGFGKYKQEATAAQRIAIRALIALADRRPLPRYRDSEFKEWFFAAVESAGWDARLEGMTAGREYWPRKTESFSGTLTKKGLSATDLQEIANAILMNPRTCAEALRLLNATGKTNEVANQIRERLRQKDVSPETRSWGEVLLRTLRQGDPG